MMNYKIIADIEELQKFIEWLPELEPHETYYVSLFARKKYAPDILKSDKSQLKRFTATKDRIIHKIKQLETETGTYTMNGITIPQEALALYISINPRDLIKATKQSIKMMVDKITNKYDGYNPHQLVLSEIHKAKSRTCFMDFDFDDMSLNDIIPRIKLNKEAYEILITRGGFHIMVSPDKVEPQYKKTWYNDMVALGCDVKGDNLIPMIGCYQGGFEPYFWKYPGVICMKKCPHIVTEVKAQRIPGKEIGTHTFVPSGSPIQQLEFTGYNSPDIYAFLKGEPLSHMIGEYKMEIEVEGLILKKGQSLIKDN